MSTEAPVTLNNNVLRDGHQSLAATRMTTEQMLPACPLLDAWGFGALETWGGATIDVGLRFLREFPFDRLRKLKEAAPKTPHMMLLRGQNIVAYDHQPDDVVQTFIKCSAQAGMDIFRIFDALNDPRNMKCAIEAAKANGKQAHGTICYTTSPVHTIEGFVKLGCELAELGSDTIVIKDMAGLIPPRVTYDLVKGLKANLKVPVWVHTHDTAGMGAPTYYAAVEAGADNIDCSIIPFANGTGQPDTARTIAMLENHPRCPQISEEQWRLLSELRTHFTKVYEEMSEFTSHKNEVIDSDALKFQVPGGMLSNFRNQLKQMKMEDKFMEVFAEVPVVREKLGWIPLVTPTSQIVGFQAVLNVRNRAQGNPMELSPQAADIALGYYGQPPAPIDPEMQALATKQTGLQPITCRPVESPDKPRKGMDVLRKELSEKNLPTDDETCVIYAMFPQQLETFHKTKDQPLPAPAKKAAPKTTGGKASSRLHLEVHGTVREILVEEV
ncbi:MAG: pyruvate carboxylase subunit B [Opitutales bacterium]